MKGRSWAARILPFALALLIAVVPWNSFDVENLSVYLAIGLVVVTMGAMIAFRGEKDLPILCHPLVVFCAFTAQFFIVGPLAMTWIGYTSFGPLSPERKTYVLMLFVLLLASVFAGFQLRLGEMVAGVLPDFAHSRRKLPRGWAETLFTLLGLIGAVTWIEVAGGLEKIMKTGYGQSKVPALFQLALHAILCATLLLGWQVLGRARRGPAVLITFAGLVFAEFLFYTFAVGARKWLFYLFFGLITIRLLRHGIRDLPKGRVVASMVALIVFFSFWGTIRSRPLSEVMAQTSAMRDYDPSNERSAYFLGLSEPFETAALVTRLFPDPEPYRLGTTPLVTLLGFIPRAVWPDKPIGLGKDLARYTDGVFYEPVTGHTVAPTILGDYYANFGIAGVLLGGLLFGISARTAAAYATRGMEDGKQRLPARVLLPAIFVSGLVELRGETASILGFYALTMIPILATLTFFSLGSDTDPVPEA